MNPAPAKLCGQIGSLAAKHRIGTVGLVGAHAAGTAGPWTPLELFVTVPFEAAGAFAHELSYATYLAVQLYDFRLVPWAHPLHLCVQWLNVDVMPVMECPRGAIMRWKLKHRGQTVEAAVPLESLPHFRATNGSVATPVGEFMRVFGPVPLGGFLMQSAGFDMAGRSCPAVDPDSNCAAS